MRRGGSSGHTASALDALGAPQELARARQLTAAGGLVCSGESARAAQFNARWLGQHLAELIGSLRGRRLCLAYSGGLDSSVLLLALASLRRSTRLRLRALHVDHHLQSDSSRWAQEALRRARQLRVPCELIDSPVRPRAGESLEAAARAMRYAALATYLKPEELLLTAHHQDDQFETVMLALLRGSGVRGLSAMAAVMPWRGTLLVRPLLALAREQLEQFARSHGLRWSEDPSNADERFDRNYLRRRVLPLIKQRWPAAAATVSRSAAHLAEARVLLEREARVQLAAARDGDALRVSVLARLSGPERRNALRYWIGECGLAAPDHRRLREIAGPLLAARADAAPIVRWRDGELRRHGDRLVAVRAAALAIPSQWWSWPQQPWLTLADGSAMGLLADVHGDVSLSQLPARLQVSFRQGGERLHSSVGRVALKDLLQAQGLAPWERTRVPLIGDGERIIAVADRWLDPAYRAGAQRAASERGRFRWRPASPGAPGGP